MWWAMSKWQPSQVSGVMSTTSVWQASIQALNAEQPWSIYRSSATIPSKGGRVTRVKYGSAYLPLSGRRF
jgi:hypothetical protein